LREWRSLAQEEDVMAQVENMERETNMQQVDI
jgi:hypothetical protein